MSETYFVRDYAAGDEVAIQSAFTRAFGVERSLAEWRWKFRASPLGSRIVLTFDAGGELVCQYAALQVAAVWGGEPVVAAQIVDVFSLRRKSLGPRGGPFLQTLERFLAACAQPDGVAFVYGFPGERHQRVGTVAGRYFAPVPLERLRCSLVSSNAAVSALASPLLRSPDLARVWIAEGFDASAADRLWNRCAGRYPFATVRDAGWTRWRYQDHPAARYAQFSVRRGGEPRAWGVLSCVGETARWVDLLWDGERREDLHALAAMMGNRAAARGCSSMEVWVRGDAPALAALRSVGFATEPEPFLHLSAISFDVRIGVPQVLSDFYLTMGDSDHF
ncbi:MAG: hypothetical protein ABI639_01740 [Thermoanaerobaculia bacterium]